MEKLLKRFIIINIGLIIMAVGLHIFLIPANLAVGGVTGLAIVIKNFIPSASIGVLMIIFNVILLIVAFIFIGKEFGGYTIYCSLALSFFVGLFEKLLPLSESLTDDILLNLIFGISVQGIGMALIFYENSSTGGTDIIAKVLNKYFNIKIGMALFIADSLITLFAGLAFGVELGLYAFLGILLNGMVIDKIISGFDTRVHALIIADNLESITDYITNKLDRGYTFFYGQGGYTKQEKRVISLVVRKREYLTLKKFINENHPDAFLIVNFVHDVIGNGFNNMTQ